ncbi:RNA polymerase sigma factor [Rhodoferax saidenbachensis]|uniref:RNA polymerase sigma factor (Sigma-70 family) n=1 Tax=Rhodoferax saidenbachensis TaxID=1484693 RepID=A0ABU1ZQT0_9BURK|nr:RNA polymerase sigma factor [Rhodoferax saidenbachensis]MDR7307882.1 RNA polymerase sigma factor (sigma-70 family) [Rhodoferax saidenbachensis]
MYRRNPPSRLPISDDAHFMHTDEHLVELSLSGDTQSLNILLRRHQDWLYNVALRMLQQPQDAEEATQESLLKIITHLSTFRGHSAFSTWAYRIAFNLILDRKRSAPEVAVQGFNCYADYLARAVDEDLGVEYGSAPERNLLVEEAKLSCLMGMLLCLDRRQRLIFLLGEIFEISDTVGSQVLEISKDNFRQLLSRARQELSAFMQDRCGLVNPLNPCRCARKTRAFVRDGIVDPSKLVFARTHVIRVKDISIEGRKTFDTLIDDTNTTLYREHPFVDAPDLVSKLRETLTGESFQTLLQLH